MDRKSFGKHVSGKLEEVIKNVMQAEKLTARSEVSTGVQYRDLSLCICSRAFGNAWKEKEKIIKNNRSCCFTGEKSPAEQQRFFRELFFMTIYC